MRILTSIALAAALATPAFADSVNVEFQPAAGVTIFAIQVNGKTTACTINSSAAANATGSAGCNFTVGIDVDGNVNSPAAVRSPSNANCSLSCGG